MARIRRVVDMVQLDTVVDIERMCNYYPWSIGMILSAYQQGDIFWLLEDLGYICVHVVRDFAELHSIAVLPDCRGRHYGEMLCKFMVDYCKGCGVQQIFLEVAVDNFVAISLYRKLGFDSVNVRKSYYDDGKDAYTMRILL